MQVTRHRKWKLTMEKPQELATITLKLYESGEVEFTGMEPYRFKTQEGFVQAINLLVKFCRKVLEEPAYTIPGFTILKLSRIVGGPCKISGGLGEVIIESSEKKNER